MKVLAGSAARFAMVVALVLFALVGCTHQQLLSPVARAFGAPPESELVRCRIAFRLLQARLETSRVQVEPVMFAEGGEGLWRDSNRKWRYDLAQAIVNQVGAHTKASLHVATTAPNVSFPQGMHHNQLGYLWDRENEYAKWVKTASVKDDYVLIAEVFSGQGKKEEAFQLYVFDARGQVALCRLCRIGGHQPDEDTLSVRAAVNLLLNTLRMDADVIFPPYGWG